MNEQQETSIPNIFCAGEPTGIGGLEVALMEGEVAGLSAIGKIAETEQLRRQLCSTKRFTAQLEKAFALRPELKALPEGKTLVCRCEDVTHAQASRYLSWRDAKNQSRCGMGPCQGRICGPAVQFFYNWRPESVRPPIFPARVQNLAAISALGEQQ